MCYTGNELLLEEDFMHRFRRMAVCLLLSAILSASILLALPTANAASVSDLTYSINNGEVTITSASYQASGSLVIPDTIEGYPVTAIAGSAFYRTNMSSITIPDSVKTIGSRAFEQCFSLSSVTIGVGVKTIGMYAFKDSYLSDVYYKGTPEQWNAISIAANNSRLTSATLHFPEHYTHPICGLSCAHETAHDNISGSRWYGGTMYNGDYYLGSNLSFSKQITVKNHARLCLNGYTLTFAEGYGLNVEEGASLTLCDCKGTGAIVRGPRTSNGDSSILNNSGTMTIYSGNYCLDGEGVGVYNSGTLDIYGGSFGVHLYNSGTATIYQANIHNGDKYNQGIFNGSGSTLTIYDCKVTSAGSCMWNNGTATIHGGTFQMSGVDTVNTFECVYNKGRLTVNDGTFTAEQGHGIYNEYNSSTPKSTLYFYGGKISVDTTRGVALYNRQTATVTGGELWGATGILNDSAVSGSTTGGGTCTVSGGSIGGSICGIRNSGNTWTSYVNGVGTKQYNKASLTINNKPTISKLVLEYPGALTFSYNGETPVDLEIDLDDFQVGDTVLSYGLSRMQKLNLLNDGYVLLYEYPDVVLATNYCGINGDNLRWKLSGDGVLTISGTGQMENFGFSANQPWNKDKTNVAITQVILEPGVTSLGTAAFSYTPGLTQIKLPEGLTLINNWAFEGCEALEQMWLPSTLTNIGRHIFTGCNTMPSEIYYAGCEHQWKNVVIDSNSFTIQPICLPNANEEDGDCTTQLLCSVCDTVVAAAQPSHTGGTATCSQLAQCEVCGKAYGDYGHVYIEHAAQAPTCTAIGWTDYRTCENCDYTTYAEKQALGHDKRTHEARAVTCLEIGWDAYETCSRCDYTTYVEQAALGHYILPTPGKAPTCTEIGWSAYESCTRCDYSTYTEKAALGHDTLSHPAQAATCTEIGWDAYETCKRCDYTTYAEKAALGHDRVSHAAQTPACTTVGWDAYETCSRCDYTTYAEKAALGHDVVSHPAQTATCTAIGWDAYETCSRCNYTTYTEFPALGHDKLTHEARAVTCLEIGWDAYETCKRCDYTTYAEKAALGHSIVSYNAKAPTCTAVGWDAYEACNRCDYTTYAEKAALGHDTVSHAAQAPTCTEMGWNAYETCSRCNFNSYQRIDPLGHEIIAHPAQAPTCTAIGWDAYETCSRCEHSTYHQLPILPHSYEASFQWSADHSGCQVTVACHCGAQTVLDGVVTQQGDTAHAVWAEYDGQEFTDVATCEKHTVTFRYADGTTISVQLLHYGAAVAVPQDPERPASLGENYAFAGWDKEITSCLEDAVYTAVFTARYTPGDMDKNGSINEDDAIYLLQHVLMPGVFPLEQSGDLNKNGTVDEDDAIYLLQHVLMPDIFPL